MKNLFIFLLGFIAGIISLIIVGIGISNSSENNMGIIGLTLFEQPEKSLSTKSFEILQVIDDGVALAQEIESVSRFGNITSDLLILLIGDDGEYFYDDQVIKIPNGKCMRQVGIYQYTTKLDTRKTIPAAKIMNK